MSEMPTCAQIMTPAVFTLAPDTPVERAAGLILRERHSGCPVVDRGRVVGVISEVDLLRALYPAGRGEPVRGTVAEHMTPTPIGLAPTATAEDAAHFFFEYPVRRAPIVDEDDRLLGLVARRDVLQAYEELARAHRRARSTPPSATKDDHGTR